MSIDTRVSWYHGCIERPLTIGVCKLGYAYTDSHPTDKLKSYLELYFMRTLTPSSNIS